MKSTFIILLCCAALCMVSTSVRADMINNDYALAADDTLTTPYNWAIVDTFDSDRPGWTYTGYGKIRSGSVAGKYAAPFNSSIMSNPDSTNFFAVPEDKTVGLTADVSFGGNEYNYLGMFWGSADSYNSLEFYNGGTLIASFDGTEIFNPANGDQLNGSSNQYVNIHLTQSFDMVKIISTDYAFELDNLAVGVQTPVPGAALLGIIGLGFAGKKLRKHT